MPDRPTDGQLIEQVRSLLTGFQGEFIVHLPPVEQTTRSRLLRIYEVWRQVNLQRLVDLAEAAVSAFETGRLVPGCTLTRGVFETVGVQYYVHKKMVEYTKNSDPEKIHNLLIAAVFGRKDAPEWDAPIQVLTAIDHMDKEMKGCREGYDHLCEYAHPNLKGGFGTYVQQQGNKLETNFGINPQGLDMGTWGLGSLRVILVVATEINNRLCAFHPEFVAMANKHAPNHPL